MGKILVLDQHMINLIAAGEVIERPASVVKELMENSIDSNASRITVEIEDGGRNLISVSDNGCGMSASDLEKAFLPHATSKLSKPMDLNEIATLGFRGEALASISSIADVEVVTRERDKPAGSKIRIDYGQREEITPASGDYGTTIQVRNLFYKTPARRKFLRSAATEMKHISECFTRIALVNPELDFKLIHNGREFYRLNGGQPVKDRISKLFSRDISENLLQAASNEKETRINAYLGMPDIARSNSKHQYIFVNGRYIRDKSLSHAVKEAYRGSIEPGKYPVVFLFIDMPKDALDVNVHPTKIEVRFFNPNLVYSQVLGTLREKLLSCDLDARGNLDYERNQAQKSKEYNNEIKDAIDAFLKKQRSSSPQPRLDFQKDLKTGTGQVRKTHQPGRDSGQKSQTGIKSGIEPHEHRAKNKFIQVHDSFIIVENEQGFSIVDQHALHERIIYERLRKKFDEDNIESQKMLIPESFAVDEVQKELIEKKLEVFAKMGIELESFGPNSMAVQAFPVILSKADPVDVVKQMLEMLEDGENKRDHEQLLDEVLHMAACKAAVKAGQRLNDAEIEDLLEEKKDTLHSSRCPHGRPTALSFSIDDLWKQFKRT